MSHVIDRWWRVHQETGRRRKTDRHGKGLRWQVEWVNGDGAKRRKSYETKDAALAAAADIRSEQHRGVYRRGSGRETFGEVAEQWLDTQLHLRESSLKTTRQRVRTTVLPSLGRRPIAAITPADVQAAVGQWALDLAPSTVRLAYAYTAAVFSHAVRADLIPKSPCQKIRLPRQPEARVVPLSDDTVAAVAEAMTDRWATMVWLLAATGIRGGEVRGLTWDRVHPTYLRIDRQRADAGAPFSELKTLHSVRSVAIGPLVHQMLVDYREAFGAGEDGTVFLGSTGRPLGRTAMSGAWKRARAKVPQAGSGWHQLRHYHASRLIAAGLSPVAVAHRLGHKDATETLQTYAHLWPADDSVMAAAGEQIVAGAMGPNVVPFTRRA